MPVSTYAYISVSWVLWLANALLVTCVVGDVDMNALLD